jgi:hypothetical protein
MEMNVRNKENHHYSGENSTAFWRRVNAIPKTEGGSVLYVMGCALQDIEGRMLGVLDELEQARRKRKEVK